MGVTVKRGRQGQICAGNFIYFNYKNGFAEYGQIVIQFRRNFTQLVSNFVEMLFGLTSLLRNISVNVYTMVI